MNNLPTDQEIDSFFDKLSNKYPIKQKCPPPSPPSQELLDLAWEAAKAHNKYLTDQGLSKVIQRYDLPIFSNSIPRALAADDSKDKSAARSFKRKLIICHDGVELIGEFYIHREDLPSEPDIQILVFKCDQELLKALCGKRLEIKAKNNIINLGKIDRRGIARTSVPRSLDLLSGYQVNFYAIEKD